jgi:hypothetical protein
MTANPHLAPILNDWHAQEAPGYALLITAPWGAGKSFAVRDWLMDKPHIYVSVFGLGSPQAINDAVFNALLAAKDFSLPASFFSGIDALAKKYAGVQIDLQGAYRIRMLEGLPKLIVFDDLERAAMPAPQLLSALNPYVEHKGKSVLLIANEAELKGSEDAPTDYRKWREKVIGRIITLTPETETALTAFLAALPEGPGKTLLIPQSPLIRSVFEASATENLRLLRQSLTDLARFLDRLPEHYRNQTHVLPALMGDFLSLSIAWHAGKGMSESDFDFHAREMDHLLDKHKDATNPSGWRTIRKLYSKVPEVILDGRALRGPLAKSLIVLGHASDQEITALMLQASAFSQTDEEPWRILWYWRSNEDAKVEKAYNDLHGQLSAHEITRPAIILHVFGIFLSLAKLDLLDLTEAGVIKQAQTYLADLLAAGKLPASWARYRMEQWQWSESSEGLGYMSRDTDAFKTILTALLAALDTAQEATRPNRLETLLADLDSDPERYRAALGGGNAALGIPDLNEDPVFLAADPTALASRIFAFHPDRWHRFLSPFKDRIERQDFLTTHHADNRPTGGDWLRNFRTAAHEVAEKSTALKRQQIFHVLRGYLAFLDPPAPETDPNP